MKTNLLLVLAFALAGCSSATPSTPTSTPIPYADIDLNAVMINLEALPADFSEGAAKPMPVLYGAFPKSANEAYTPLVRNGKAAGGIAVFLFENPKDVESAYSALVYELGEDVANQRGIGEKAAGANFAARLTNTNLLIADLAFVRCGAVAHVRMEGFENLEAVTAYAKSLDARLQPLVCR